MKLITFAMVLSACMLNRCLISAEIYDFLLYKEGQRFFYAPDKNGRLQLVDLLKEEANTYDPESDMIFRLFTRKNPTEEEIILYGDVQNLTLSNYDSSKQTKFFTHGWNSNSNTDCCFLPRNGILSNLDANVICVDWSVGADVAYTTAVKNVPPTGQMMAKFIDWLISQGTSIDNIHITGHSLGAHVAGVAGRSVTSGTISYITAFDPANPLWGADSDRIRPSDATYVEVIHTNAGIMGLADPVGDNDFYPNGGRTMPGCSILDVGCSHSKSYEYFEYSINSTDFMSNECADYTEIVEEICSDLSQLHMGGARPKDARGVFWLATSDVPPYHLGDISIEALKIC